MKPNIGIVDRALRIVIGLALIGLALWGVIGPWGYLGVLPLMTAIFRFCPAYAVLGLRTCADGIVQRRSR